MLRLNNSDSTFTVSGLEHVDLGLLMAPEILEEITRRVLPENKRNRNPQDMSLVDLGKQLLESAKLGETEEVRLLMTNGAPFTTDWLGFSPLHMAAQFGHLTTAEVLLRAGISRDARTKVDRTPLHIAAQEGHLDIVDLLVNHGAEVDARDMLKMTPLHWAIERGHYHVTSFLLKSNADVTATSKFEKTPLDIAEDNDHGDIVDLLHVHTANMPSVKSESAPPSITNFSSVKTLPTTVQTSPIVISSTCSTAVTSSLHTVKSPSVTKPVFLRANLADFQKATTTNTYSHVSSSDSEEGESNEQSCTSVLATLAALAEATAPNATISTADALHWLESHGIQMLPTDNSTVVASALEGGQTVALTVQGLCRCGAPCGLATHMCLARRPWMTEAGKLALTFVKEHQNLSNSSVEVSSSTVDPVEKDPVTSVSSSTSQKVITIVGDQSQIPSIISGPQTPIVVLSSQPVSSNVVDSSPTVKKIKLNHVKKDDVKVINGNAIKSNITQEDDPLQLKQELETVKKENEIYKAQLRQKVHEAELYKRQLEEMRTLPRVNQ